jgi:bacterioferritin (cytochrome b1)
VDKRIARLNIEHFRQRLAEEQDEVKRQMLRELLAKEEDKLKSIETLERKHGDSSE